MGGEGGREEYFPTDKAVYLPLETDLLISI